VPDPNATPIGNDAGTLAPDSGKLQADISDIESEFEPRIQKSEEQAQSYQAEAIHAEESVSQEAATVAGELSAEDQEMQHWVDHTPTRQAAYASSMHAAPVLAILTAIGGKLTKLNGMQMLAATNGIVQGLNESSEKKYQDAMAAWQSSYEKMRDHQRRLGDAHKMMLDAYRGRADAYQKATEAARRMTGDILDDKQRKVTQSIDTFKAQSAAWDKIQRIKVAQDANHERMLKDIHQDAHWKELEKKTAGMPPEIKAQIAQEGARRQSAKQQKDANLKVRGQISNNLDMPADIKAEQLKRIDDENAALDLEINKALSNGDAIVAGFSATRQAAPGARPAAAAGHPAAQPVKPGGEQPSPGKLAEIKKHPAGSTVKFGDGSSWIMDADGTARRVQ
jgi:hypothetical protein